MNNFMEKRGKMLPLISGIVLAVAFLGNFIMAILSLVSAVVTPGYGAMPLISARNITEDVLLGLTILVFAACAVLYWKKQKDFYLPAAGSAVGIFSLFVTFVFSVILSIKWGNISYLFAGILVRTLLLAAFAYLIVVAFLKINKPLLAYIAAGLLGLLLVVAFISDGINVIGNLVNVIRYLVKGMRFERVLPFLISLLLSLCNGFNNLLFYAGLLVLNFTLLWNKACPLPEAEEAEETEQTAEATEETVSEAAAPAFVSDAVLFDE